MTRKVKQLKLDFGKLNSEAKQYVKAGVRVRRAKKMEWRGIPAVPPGSLIEQILEQFQNCTNIPLELPFFTFLHYVSGYLVGRGVTLMFGSHEIRADIWTIVLAESGAGKTWTEKMIDKAFGGCVPLLDSGAASAAKFLQDLAENPHALWIRDEFYQLLRQIDSDGPMADMRDYLLRTYDNSRIERSTKRDSIVVEEPVLSILAFTALQSYIDGMNPESLVDGFAQRFGYVIARTDSARKWIDYAVWDVNYDGWRNRWESLVEGVHDKYIATPEGIETFKNLFRTAIGYDMEESFARRIMWRAHKYALCYHIACGHAADQYIGEEDYGWAARLITMQFADSAELLERVSGSDLEKVISDAERVIAKLVAEGKEPTPRLLTQRTRSIKNVSEARFVFELLKVAA